MEIEPGRFLVAQAGVLITQVGASNKWVAATLCWLMPGSTIDAPGNVR